MDSVRRAATACRLLEFNMLLTITQNGDFCTGQEHVTHEALPQLLEYFEEEFYRDEGDKGDEEKKRIS